MVSGYLKDEHFESRIEISRKLASPSRIAMSARDESGLGMANNTASAPNEALNLTSQIDEEQKNNLAKRKRKNMDLANRSRTRV